MKLLHAADLHLDSPLSATPALRRIQLMLPRMLAELCRSEGCDAVLLSGDLFDGQWSRQSLDALRGALAEMAVPVFISPGNHDFLSPDSPYIMEKWPENVHIFTSNVITSVTVPALDLRVYGAGYRGIDCDGLLEGFRAEGTERYHVALLHGDPTHVDSPYCPVTATQVRESGLHYLALGHVHKGDSFWEGETLCAWPGCPMGRGFDELGAKGVLIVTLEELAQVRFVPLPVPCFHELETDDRTLSSLLPPTGSEDYYRITLTGEQQEDVAALLGRFPNLELRDRRTPPIDAWSALQEDSLEGALFRSLRQQTEGPERELAARIVRQLLDGQEVAL
ncbi:MAG: metallophosphoesterase [Oscillospiraceae bacterium]|nr:metallophosphoesterase [Oscillospiraceae bacterium]